MEFRIQRKEDENLHKYPSEDLAIARKFGEKLRKELQDFVMGVVVFGSTVRREATEKSDIDVLVVTNDTTYLISEAFVEGYRIIVERLMNETSDKLHVNSMTFTSFWEAVKAGDPVVVNMLRDGVALFDSGFFDPMQRLLKLGRLRPSEESVWHYFGRAPKTLLNSRWHVLQATLDLYWAVIDAAHAALMRKDVIPPTPEHVADLLERTFVKHKQLEMKYVETMRRFYRLSKMITYREIKEISGPEFERYYHEADEFVRRMKRLIERGTV